MMPLTPRPLVQLMATAPMALWGVQRHDLGYRGPTLRVRRTSDGAIKECYSIADIESHCVGTNGWIASAYDQRPGARTLTQATAANQPKIFDSVTGLIRTGRVPMIRWTEAAESHLTHGAASSYLDLVGSNPAITSATAMGYVSGTTATASRQIATIGDKWASGGAAASNWIFNYGSGSTIRISARTPDRFFTPVVDVTTVPSVVVWTKTAGQDVTGWSMRQNGVDLSVATTNAGTMNLQPSPSSVVTTWGCAPYVAATAGNASPNMQASVLAHWAGTLSAAEIARLELYFSRLKGT